MLFVCSYGQMTQTHEVHGTGIHFNQPIRLRGPWLREFQKGSCRCSVPSVSSTYETEAHDHRKPDLFTVIVVSRYMGTTGRRSRSFAQESNGNPADPYAGRRSLP